MTDQYRELINAIITKACDDYIRIPKERFDRNSIQRQKIEEFFRSDRFAVMSNVDPDYLIRMLIEKRDWNERIRNIIFEQFGSYKAFGKAVWGSYQRATVGYLGYYLKTAQYPSNDEMERIEAAIKMKGEQDDKIRRSIANA